MDNELDPVHVKTAALEQNRAVWNWARSFTIVRKEDVIDPVTFQPITVIQLKCSLLTSAGTYGEDLRDNKDVIQQIGQRVVDLMIDSRRVVK